jgi:tetraacyldisaccharide 4'-kinase
MGIAPESRIRAEAGATARAVDALLGASAGSGSLSRGWLAPLTPLYAAGWAAKNSAYDRGWLRAKSLRHPVVSIGNLSVGGSGKTPLTIRLAELLAGKGLAVDVLSRGYGRRSTVTERVDPSGSADRYGDEPLLIARQTGAPVYVGGSRYEAGLLAESDLGSSSHSALHLLDDGFQHRKLARDVDVVVLHRSDFSERLLPAGRLREPLSAMRRADFVVLREEDAEFEGELRRRGIEAPVWFMRRTLDIAPAHEAERVVAFCGVARPEEFFAALTNAGMVLASRTAFRDHHRYSAEDVQRLAQLCVETHADAFVTTEKDAVKLDSAMLEVLEKKVPLRVARLLVSLQDEKAVARQLSAKLLAS